MATFTLDFYHQDADGNLADCDSAPKLSDATGSYGIWRGAKIIVADDTAMTKDSTGHYSYTLTYADTEDTDKVLYNTTYNYAVEYIYGGLTDFFEDQFTTDSEISSTRGTAGWACDRVETLSGNTTAGNALPFVQAGYERFLAGIVPGTNPPEVHTWSFLPSFRDLAVAASDEDTATGTYSGTELTLTTTNAFFTSTAVDAGRYVTIQDVGTYPVASVTSTKIAVLTVASGQYATDFATAKTCWFEAILKLPSDFNGMSMVRACYPYTDTYDVSELEEVSVGDIQRMWRGNQGTDETPRWYALAPQPFVAGTGQRWQLWLARRPANARIIRYWPRVDPTLLTDSTSVFFVGGSMHWECIVALALAQWEWENGRVRGPMEARAQELLAASIALDKALFTTERIESLADYDTGIKWHG